MIAEGAPDLCDGSSWLLLMLVFSDWGWEPVPSQ